MSLVEGEWNHLSLAYRHMGETLDVALYANFEKSSMATQNNPLRQQAVTEKYMGGGDERSAFGIMDELIFPEFLSDSQIAQLNQTYKGM